MAYIPITNAQVDPDSPVTAELMTALRDNPEAIANGDAGAPPVVVYAVKGESATFSISTSVTDRQTLVFPKPIKHIMANLRFDAPSASGSGTVSFFIAFSSDGGASFGAETTLGSASLSSTASASASTILSIDLSNSNAIWSWNSLSSGSLSGGGLTTMGGIPSNCNAIRFRVSAGGGKTSSARGMVMVLGGQ